MTDYTPPGDPYLSDKTNADMARLRADGVDLSLVDKFLEDTAHLVAPVQAPRSSPWPFLVAMGVIALAVLCWLFP